MTALKESVLTYILLHTLAWCVHGYVDTRADITWIARKLQALSDLRDSGILDELSQYVDTNTRHALITQVTQVTPGEHPQDVMDSPRVSKEDVAGKYFDVESVLAGEFGAMPRNYSVSPICAEHMTLVILGLFNRSTWATTMLDATAKPPSGISQGALTWPGSRSLCQKVIARIPPGASTPVFKGQYCTTTIANASKYTHQAEAMEEGPMQMALTLGVCLPDSCTSTDASNLLNKVLVLLPEDIQVVDSTCGTFAPTQLNSSAIAVLCLLSILAFILITATAYDILVHQPNLERQRLKNEKMPRESQRDKEDYTAIVNSDNEDTSDKTREEGDGGVDVEVASNEHTPLLGGSTESAREGHGRSKGQSMSKALQCLLAFSVYTNSAKILNTSTSREGTLSAVHGVRFLSMTWVILGHAIAMLAMNMISDNTLVLMDWIKTFLFQAIINATVSVDTFFLLSGTLLSYLLLREMKERGRVSAIHWPKFYFHRFWRLTPPYMLVLAVWTSLFAYMGDGPFWSLKSPDPSCAKNWWTNLLYINNLVNPSQMCQTWSWYLANDMQFFILSPLFVIPLFMWFPVGLVMAILGMITTTVTTGVITYVNNYSAAILLPQGNITQQDQNTAFNNVYITPWCRLGAYLVGILLGYALYKTDRPNFRMHKLWLVLGWCTAIVCSTSALYGLYEPYRGNDLDPWVNALYAALGRPVWALGVAWLVFACCRGYGGFVNTLLSWGPLVVLSRLTYMAYLVHPMEMYFFYFTQESLLHITVSNVVMWFFGHLVASYALAFVLSLAFEAPMIALEKVLLPK